MNADNNKLEKDYIEFDKFGINTKILYIKKNEEIYLFEYIDKELYFISKFKSDDTNDAYGQICDWLEKTLNDLESGPGMSPGNHSLSDVGDINEKIGEDLGEGPDFF